MAIFDKTTQTWAEMELDRIETRDRQQKDAAAMRFNELHHQGAHRFGTIWLTSNMAVNSLRNKPWLPQEDKRIDALVSECAWILAETNESRKPILSAEEKSTLRNLRNASDKYDPFTKDEIMSLVSIIDRLVG